MAAIEGKVVNIPRNTEITGYTIKYDDGSEKQVDEAIIIYKLDDTGVSVERNGDFQVTIGALISLAVMINSMGLNVERIVHDAINNISSGGKEN